MLTPTRLDKLPEPMIQLMAELQDDIITDLCRRIVKSGGEMDCDLVEGFSHFGARPSHAEWQGQIYFLKKGHPKYAYFNDATGYGTGDGLGGWNCRHSFFPYFEGISEAANAPDFTAAENLEVYNNEQRQRALERGIRKSKRELAEHCKNTGTYIDTSRVRVDGFGRSVSQKAYHTATKSYLQYMKQLGIENPPKSIAIYNQMMYNNSPEYKLMNKYMTSVKNGMLSPLAGYEKYKEYHKRIETEIIGMKTLNGIVIKSQSDHFLERVFGTLADPTHNNTSRSGVELPDIIDALKTGRCIKNPKKSDSISFVTSKCLVSVNPKTGNLIQTNLM